MTEEATATAEVDDTVSTQAGEDSETQETEQETQPEKNEEAEQTYTKAEVEAMFDKKSARLRRQLKREFEEKNAPAQPKKEQSVEGKPKLDDFESTEEWVEAVADWKVRESQAETAKQAEERRQKEETDKIIKSFEKKAAKFEATHPDFQDAMDDLKDYQIPGYIMEAVMTSDLGADVAYYLGNNQEKLDEMLEMSPAAAVRAIGRLEVKLENADPTEVSQAPAPLKTLKGKGTVEDNTYKSGDNFEKFLDVRFQELGRGKRKR